ncbi:MAG: hypothetical protein AB8G05_19820 [Oligoflexales bacterium]
MKDAKADLSIKFSEMPVINSEGKKNVALTFKTSVGTVICNVKSKTYRKAVKTSEEFDTWIAAISGKDLSTEGGVITMSGCGIQVFEKKPKVEAKGDKPVEVAKSVEEKQEEPKAANPEPKPKNKTHTREHRIGGKRIYVPEPVKVLHKVRKSGELGEPETPNL